MILRIINTAMICGLLMTVLDPMVMLYYVSGWFHMVLFADGA